MKQTAVEWFIDKLSSQPIDDINDEYWFGIIGQAKQMEKEQIIQANRDGVDMVVDGKPFISGEGYYQETFKED